MKTVSRCRALLVLAVVASAFLLGGCSGNTNQAANLDARITALEAGVRQLQVSMSSLLTQMNEIRQDLTPSGPTPGSSQAGTDSSALGDRVASLESRVTQLRSDFDNVALLFNRLQELRSQSPSFRPGPGQFPSGDPPPGTP
jgi:outer membrane murein-binding lipoprotein Lpp